MAIDVSYSIPRPNVPPLPGELEAYHLVSEYETQRQRYTAYWDWYDGRVFQLQGNQYPLAINPVRLACILHRNALFGMDDDTAEPLVKSHFTEDSYVADEVNKDDDPLKQSETQKKAEKRARLRTELVNRVWQQSSGRALQLENGLISQALGGCYFAVRFDPSNTFLALPIRIEIIHPEEIIPITSQADRWHMYAAHVIRYISHQNALLQYGVDIGSSKEAVYHEYWTRDTYLIEIDGKVVLSGGEEQKGENPFGVVPFVYIPHEREGNHMYGVPVMHQTEGMVTELNARMADVGDGVRLGVHRKTWARNLQKQPGKVRIDDELVAIDLGGSFPGGNPPEVGVIDPPDIPTETAPYLDSLDTNLNKAQFTPDVAYGIDEGSQRSGLTLSFRFWPMSSHIGTERSFWTTGLNVVAEYILRIAAAYKVRGGLEAYAITEDDFNKSLRQDWFPMLPRDEEQEEASRLQRKNAGLLSQQTALEQQDDIDEPKRELRLIAAEQKQEDKRQAALAKATAEEASQSVANKDKSAPGKPKPSTGSAKQEKATKAKAAKKKA